MTKMMDLTNKKYFIPDETWTTFGIMNQKSHFEKYVIRSNFHKEVHEDIINCYETVEYLMVHAYYHWPMFDEALKKMLGIFEMAIKLRSQELNNQITYQDKKGKTQKKKLYRLIEDFKIDEYPDVFIDKLHWIRKQRNMDAHPERHSFGGALYMQSLYSIKNAINELFLSADKLNANTNQFKRLQELNSDRLKGLYSIPHDGQQCLAFDPKIITCWKRKNSWIVVIFFNPVLNKVKELLEERIIPNPIFFILSNFEFTKDRIEGENFYTEEKMILQKTTKSENLDRYKIHLDEWNEINIINQQLYQSSHESTVYFAIEKAVYQTW